MHFSLVPGSSNAVMTIVGILTPQRFRWCCSSSPVMFGICRSVIKHSGMPRGRLLINSHAVSKICSSYEEVSRSRLNAILTDASSSTTAIRAVILIFDLSPITRLMHWPETRRLPLTEDMAKRFTSAGATALATPPYRVTPYQPDPASVR